MGTILATGGLDELAIDAGYMIFSGVFLVLAGLIAYSWWRRSMVAAGIACMLVLADGALIQPWEFIVTKHWTWPYDDHWQFRMRLISVIWSLFVIVAAVCLARANRQWVWHFSMSKNRNIYSSPKEIPKTALWASVLLMSMVWLKLTAILILLFVEALAQLIIWNALPVTFLVFLLTVVTWLIPVQMAQYFRQLRPNLADDKK